MNREERLERTIARQEDALFRSATSIMRLIERVEVLAAEVERLRGSSPWAPANEAKAVAHRERVALVQRLTLEGKSIAKIHQETGISTRHIPRLRHEKL